MIRAVTSNCDFNQLGDFLQMFLPSDFPSEIFNTIGAFTPMLSQLQIPRCPGERLSNMKTQYYE